MALHVQKINRTIVDYWQPISCQTIQRLTISCLTTFSPWALPPFAHCGQSANEWMRHQTSLPHVNRDNLVWYKNRLVRRRGHVLLWDSHRPCVFNPPLSHLLFDELPDDPGHLISVHLHHWLGDFDAFVGICCSSIQYTVLVIYRTGPWRTNMTNLLINDFIAIYLLSACLVKSTSILDFAGLTILRMGRQDVTLGCGFL